MSEPKNIERRAATFLRQGVMLSAGLFLLGLLIVQVGYFWQLQMPLIVSAVYLLVIEMAAGLVWKRVARKSLDRMPTFLMGLSGGRCSFITSSSFPYVTRRKRTVRENLMIYKTKDNETAKNTHSPVGCCLAALAD